MTIVALKVKNLKKPHFFAKKCKLRKYLLPLGMKTTVVHTLAYGYNIKPKDPDVRAFSGEEMSDQYGSLFFVCLYCTKNIPYVPERVKGILCLPLLF